MTTIQRRTPFRLSRLVVRSVLALGAMAATTHAQAVIERSTFGTGGGVVSGAGVQIVGTAGQIAVGPPAQSGTLILAHGLWAASTPACPADLTLDGVVNTPDLTRFLGQLGKTCPQVTPPCADFNIDGRIDTADLVFFLGRFGQPCPL